MSKVTIKEEELSYHTMEGIKSLRTNLMFCRDDRKVIAITSSVANEGKSTIALDLAKSLTELNKNVLLIDTDLRRSVIASRVTADPDLMGLSHFLSGQAKITDVLASTNIKNLHLIISGQMVPNQTELLSSALFEKMIATLREHYDYIIIDTAPIGLVVDSAIVAKNCDGAIFVVESGKIKYRFAQRAVARFEASGCKILGVVVNKFDMKRGGEYYKKFYKKYYVSEKE